MSEAKEQAVPVKALAVNPETQQIVVRDANEQVRLIKRYMDGGAIPESFKTIEQAQVAWTWAGSLYPGKELTLLQNMAIINGKASLWGEAPKALAFEKKLIEYCQPYLYDEDYKELKPENKNCDSPFLGAACKIKRTGGVETTYHFTIEDAKKARLWEKRSANGKETPWITYPKVMMMRRVQGMALKFECSDLFLGMAIAEYDFNEAPDIKDVTPKTGSAAHLLNTKFKSKPDTAAPEEEGEAVTVESSSSL